MAAPAVAAPVESKEVKTLTFGELRQTTFPPGNFIVEEGLLPKDGILVMAGPPKSYKSFILSTILYHLVTGTNLFGAHRKPHGRAEAALGVTKPQRVLLLEQEIGFYDVRERLMPLWDSLSGEQRDLMDRNLAIHSRDHTMQLDKVDGCKRIDSIIKAFKPDVVAFDPLIEFHTANENDTQSMAQILHNLDIMRNTMGFASLINHHTAKPNSSSAREGPDLMRGSGVVFGKGDSFLMLQPKNRNHGQVRIDFTIRRGAPIRSMSVLLDWKELRAKFHCWQNSNGATHISVNSDSDEENIQ